MDFLPDEIDRYCIEHSQDEPLLLAELNRFTHNNVLQPRMLAGHFQGRALSMLSKMIQPKIVVEIGTYTGYSALCWAEGLAKGGVVHTIEINDELESKINSFFEKSEFGEFINLHIGPALKLLRQFEAPIDIVYIDADKENYSAYYDCVFDKVRSGGYITADRGLWSGKITNNIEKMDFETKCLYEYSLKVKADVRVENVLFPIRDGLMIARKR